MTNNLRKFLETQEQIKNGIAHGLKLHSMMQHSDMENKTDITARICENPFLVKMFDSLSRAEAPIAGYLNGKFISRRIDRLRIDNENKIIEVLDFKTDSDKELWYCHYKKQLTEYKQLLLDVYPNCQVSCYILWLHDWTVTQVI